MKSDVTVRKPKDEKMDTEYGYITHSEWCKKELKRIKHNIEYKEKKGICWLQKMPIK